MSNSFLGEIRGGTRSAGNEGLGRMKQRIGGWEMCRHLAQCRKVKIQIYVSSHCYDSETVVRARRTCERYFQLEGLRYSQEDVVRNGQNMPHAACEIGRYNHYYQSVLHADIKIASGCPSRCCAKRASIGLPCWCYVYDRLHCAKRNRAWRPCSSQLDVQNVHLGSIRLA